MSKVWQGLFLTMILILFTVHYSFANSIPVDKLLPPQHQIKKEIPSDNVLCSSAFVLVKKSSDNSVACVNAQTAQKLVERGWGVIYNQSQANQFISKEDAIRLFEKHLNSTNGQAIPYGFFAFLKFNGTQNGKPVFIIYNGYQTDAETIWINDKAVLVFDNPNMYDKYLSDKLIDRFIWVTTFHSSLPIIYYFVDAKTGEIIGSWNTCPSCV